jgi:hypothetical protein
LKKRNYVAPDLSLRYNSELSLMEARGFEIGDIDLVPPGLSKEEGRAWHRAWMQRGP